jgi:DNA-binding transcriptional LysR family regulator
MNISSVNLNLLVAFQALLEERSVTRAARRSGVSQPAMSNSLAQLRALFGDRLFTRTAHGLEPTPRALALAAPLRDGLAKLGELLDARPFDPRTATRRFVIAASDYVEFVLLPPLLERLRGAAPNLRLEIRPWGLHEIPEGLARGEIDLLIGYYDRVPPNHAEQLLFEDEYVCVVRRRHPRVQKKLTLKSYLELDHVLVSQKSDSPGSVDRALAARGKQRRVAVRVSHFLLVPTLIARTDFVAALDRRAAEPFAKPLGLRLLEPPLPLPRGRVGQVWHTRVESDAGHRFLRDAIARVSAEL